MRVVIRGSGGPGLQWMDGTCATNVHVGLQKKSEPVDLRPGDVATTEWTIEVDVVDKDGAADFRGPFVHGRRGERFVYLTWGDVDDSGAFAMFRRAKLPLSRVDPALVANARTGGSALMAEVALTGNDGGPICATPDDAHLRWSAR